MSETRVGLWTLLEDKNNPSAVKFMDLFNKYNKSIGFALQRLHEQPQDIVGREKEIALLYAILERPQTPVALLLGEAGVGKTALVEEFSKQLNSGTYPTRLKNKYLLVSLRIGNLASLGTSQLQAALSNILSNLKHFESRAQKVLNDSNIRVVLFIDEVHMLVTIFGPGTKIGGDVIKDTLARAPVRVIAATTRREYDSTIAVDKPLAERFKQIELNELPANVVHDICINWWLKVAPDAKMPSSETLKELIRANHIYRSDSAEPRRSLDILEDLVSYARRTGERPGREQLVDLFKSRYSVSLDFSVDADHVYSRIESRIKGQPHALYVWKRLLRSMVFQLDTRSDKPMMTALLTGPTGSGKALENSTLIPVNDERGYVPIGDLQVGDTVFDMDGKPTKVVGVYPQGVTDLFEVTVGDGEKIVCCPDHLWLARTAKLRKTGKPYRVLSTKNLVESGVLTESKCRQNIPRFWIPQNKAVERSTIDLPLPPYTAGVLIGDGCMTEKAITVSSNDIPIIKQVSHELESDGFVRAHEKNYSWKFLRNSTKHGVKPNTKYIQQNDYNIDNLTGIFGVKSINKHIPPIYFLGSFEQRLALLQGLMDTDGHVGNNDRLTVSFGTVSKNLAYDVKELAASLGFKTAVHEYSRKNQENRKEYQIVFKISDDQKSMLFRLDRHLKTIKNNKKVNKTKHKHYDDLPIHSIQKLDRQGLTTCITVDSPTHSYLCTKNHIVTHNTETVKAISETLYPGENVLKHINMPDYKTAGHEPAFRKRLGEIIRHKPNSIILLDEFEKAHEAIRDSMLVILDEGLITFEVENREGLPEVNTVSMRNSIVICTTNAGSEVFANDARFSQRGIAGRDELTDINRAEIEQLQTSLYQFLQAAGFKPEMLGRFDRIIPYRGLTSDTLITIAENKLNQLAQKFYDYKNIVIKYEEPHQWPKDVFNFYTTDIALYIAFIRAKADDPNSGGARAIHREIDTYVYDEIIDTVIDNPDHSSFLVTVDKNSAIYQYGAGGSEGGIIVTPI